MKWTWMAIVLVFVMWVGPRWCFGEGVVTGGSAHFPTTESSSEETSTFDETQFPTPEAEEEPTHKAKSPMPDNFLLRLLYDEIQSQDETTSSEEDVETSQPSPRKVLSRMIYEVYKAIYIYRYLNVNSTAATFIEDLMNAIKPESQRCDISCRISNYLSMHQATATPFGEGLDTTTLYNENVETNTASTPFREDVETATLFSDNVESTANTHFDKGIYTTTPFRSATITTTNSYEQHTVDEQDSSLLQQTDEPTGSSYPPKQRSGLFTDESPVFVPAAASFKSVYTLGNHSVTSSPGNSKCGGKLSTTGSLNTTAGNWPWAVLLKDKHGVHYCGGVLIASRHVLTAAHCIGHPDMMYRLPLQLTVGQHDTSITKESVPTTRWVSLALQHIQYSYSTWDNDIGILVVQEPIDTQNVTQICLPSPQMQLPVGSNVYITGWGVTMQGGAVVNPLRDVQATVLPHSACTSAYQSLYKDDRMFCVGDALGGKDECQDDSGGPLLYEDTNKRWFVVGVLSFGSACGRAQYPGVYSSVPFHLDIITWAMNNS